MYWLAIMVCCYAGLCVSCGDEEMSLVEYERRLVVEGRIEAGEYPEVTLTYSSSFAEDLDTTYLLQHVITSAKVTVSDGTNTEVLALGRNPGHIPPFKYYATNLQGATGKTYHLKVEAQGQVFTAETHIPAGTPLEEVTFRKGEPQDSTGHLYVRFRDDDPTVRKFFLFSTRVVGKEHGFTPCLHGAVSNSLWQGQTLIEMQLNKGPIIYPKASYNTTFPVGEEVEVKLSVMPEHGYLFWASWQEEVLNAQNPIFPAYTSLKTNINNGIGLWCGYASTVYRLRTE